MPCPPPNHVPGISATRRLTHSRPGLGLDPTGAPLIAKKDPPIMHQRGIVTVRPLPEGKAPRRAPYPPLQTYRKPESEPNPNPETNPRSIVQSHGERPNPELCRKVLTSSWDGTSRLWQRPERQSWEDQDMIHWRLVLPALKGSRPLKALVRPL